MINAVEKYREEKEDKEYKGRGMRVLILNVVVGKNSGEGGS